MTPLKTAPLCFVLALLISCASGQVATQCSPFRTLPKFRFMAQLSVNGCSVFVHDTGAKGGLHLTVEPIMCVTQSLHNLLPRFDPFTQQTYVSVPVMLRDDAMLTQVQAQLQHLSPKSVNFATVSDISVYNENALALQVLAFVWSPEESVAFLRVGCIEETTECQSSTVVSRMRAAPFKELHGIQLQAKLVTNESHCSLYNYRIFIQNHTLVNFKSHIPQTPYLAPTSCRKLRFVRAILMNNCTARVHERLDMKGHFLIEPLLCHNITSFTNESIVYDYIREIFYLKLDIVLQDDITLAAVRSKLADLSPRNVTFMRLWRAESVVASALSRSFEIGPLMVSGDWRSGQMPVYCRTRSDCEILWSWVNLDPVDLWRQIKWSVASVLSDGCIWTAKSWKYSWRMKVRSVGMSEIFRVWMGLCKQLNEVTTFTIPCTTAIRQDLHYIVIQQRLTGRLGFQRGWSEYEKGFGDGTELWIGLSTIHSLSINGATLRVEMKLWNGTQLHAEYAGFKVGDASTNYIMTYRDMIRDRSSISFDGLGHHKGSQFSTMDRDNDRSSLSCSNSYGKSGWWFNNCHHVNPNGIYGGGSSVSDMIWHSGSVLLPLREVRLMLQI